MTRQGLVQLTRVSSLSKTPTTLEILQPRFGKTHYLPSNNKNRPLMRLSCPILYVCERCKRRMVSNLKRIRKRKGRRKKSGKD